MTSTDDWAPGRLKLDSYTYVTIMVRKLQCRHLHFFSYVAEPDRQCAWCIYVSLLRAHDVFRFHFLYEGLYDDGHFSAPQLSWAALYAHIAAH